MRKRRRIVSEKETHRVVTVTVRGQSMLAWCAECDREIELVALEGADALADKPTGGHFKATRDGKTWVCCRWLSLQAKRRKGGDET